MSFLFHFQTCSKQNLQLPTGIFSLQLSIYIYSLRPTSLHLSTMKILSDQHQHVSPLPHFPSQNNLKTTPNRIYLHSLRPPSLQLSVKILSDQHQHVSPLPLFSGRVKSSLRDWVHYQAEVDRSKTCSWRWKQVEMSSEVHILGIHDCLHIYIHLWAILKNYIVERWLHFWENVYELF